MSPLIKSFLTAAFMAAATPSFAQTSEPAVDIKGMKEWRQQFHAHPETAFEEVRTAAKVAELLKSWDIETHTSIGKTGVVGVLRGQGSALKPAMCLRADMDALPITELDKSLPYRSQNVGKMHACGHDGHTAMLLGAAKHLAKTRNFSGTVFFIFQPAEEAGGGAEAMLKDGLLEKFPCDTVYGLHTWPALPAGKIAVSEGPITAATDFYKITLTGKGGHAALPEYAIDPVAVAVQVAKDIESFKKENLPAGESAILALTNIHAGEAPNAIPESATLGGTVRTFSPTTQDSIEKALRDIPQKRAQEAGAKAATTYDRVTPSVVNAPAETEKARKAAESVVGKENVVSMIPTTAGEDFAYFSKAVPGAYVALGQGSADKPGLSLHNPSFDFNDGVLETGALYWVKLVEKGLPLTPEKPLENKEISP